MIEKQKVIQAMANILGQPVERLDDDTVLTAIVADSFVLVDLAIELQEEFSVRFDDLRGVTTVRDLVRLIAESPPQQMPT